MPVQIRDQHPVRRPLGQVAPEPVGGGRVELRLHGVGGTTPENLLGDLAPQLVAGDRIAGFYRTADQPAVAGAGDDRHVEGYAWGGLTSRSASRVLWILMLPFALANVAGWMCTPRVLASPWRFHLHRYAVRFAGLMMTLNVVILLLVLGEDLVATQCANTAGCRSSFRPASWLIAGPFAHHAGRAMAVGALAPIAMLIVFEVLSRVSSGRYEDVRAPQPVDAGAADVEAVQSREFGGTAARPAIGLTDGDFWHGYQSARRLSALHVCAGIATTAGVLAWTTSRTLAAADDIATTVVLLVSAAVVVLVCVLIGPDTCSPRWTRTLVPLSIATLVAAIASAWTVGANANQPGVVHAMRLIGDGMYAAIAVGIVGTGAAIVIGGGRGRGRFLMFGPAIVLALAFGMANGFGALITMRFGAWIGFPQINNDRDRSAYAFTGSVATWDLLVTLAVIVILALVAAVLWWRSGRRDNSAILDDYDESGGGDPWLIRPDRHALTDDDRRWLAGIARFRFLARLPRRLDLLLAVIVLAALASTGIIEYRYWNGLSIRPFSAIATAASFSATLAPIALLAIVRLGWRSNAARKHIGVAWDVATFWPRAYHPYAPPCYAERAVPDLQWRIWYLQAKGADVTIAAHSQGTVIAAAAALQARARRPGSSVNLLTFGSPLDTLYGWAFPAYFGNDVLDRLGASIPRWHNYFYRTDYIGNTPILGADNHVIPDPPSDAYVLGQPRPAIGSHTGYWTDPAVWPSVEDAVPVDGPSRDVPRARVSESSEHEAQPG